MLQVMLLRILLIIFSSGILYICLLYFIGWQEDGYLKRRIRKSERNRRNNKSRIILIYLLVLSVGLSIYFLMIKYFVRGAL